MSIRLRLTAWYACILAVSLILFGSAVYGVVHYNTYSDLKKKLVEQGQNIKPGYIIDVSRGQVTFDISFGNFQAGYGQYHNYQNGETYISKNFEQLHTVFPVPSSKAAANAKEFDTIYLNGNPFLVYQKAFILENNQVVGFLQLAVFTGHEENLLRLLRSILIISATIMLIMATTFGLFLARKSMAPIEKVIEAADQIQNGADLSVRITYDGPQDEIGQLINTVNSMLGRMEGFYKNLEESYAAQRRFVSDASHELRTPLTTIRGNVDLLQKMWSKDDLDRTNLDEETMHTMTLEAVSDIADESKRMSRLVSDMLSLARADTGRTFEKEPVPLEILVEEVARRAKMLPRTAEWVTGDFSILNGVYINGNKDYMQQMLFVFIENAFKYTPEGQVSFDAFIYKNQVGIRISDTGIGMDKEEVPYIFDRFYRADQSRGVTEGIGLGLSIAKWIIDEMQGSVEVVTRLGEGTTFVIWLPIVYPTPLE
ncbi:HAMP domain-containing sensor histidine kinase [Paenibacillus sp.]|jgi:signal transduction histidine kinase|uniref:sensor histidine kinase n=1 Tax=Paenibacillus sp. TaxID=58172 RepID=UPI002817DFFE|nr:HAMP domain-containing sensor histidine kinase [Paenibacillus sp.]MDR0268766.1 HAMP domain-containing histidine kinase [Paenibacillus sp.]